MNAKTIFSPDGTPSNQCNELRTRFISPDEWKAILIGRGQIMTGLLAHAMVCDSTPQPLYYWCMGEQPPKAVRDLISDVNPIAAAEKYLAHFETVDGVPVARKKDPVQTLRSYGSVSLKFLAQHPLLFTTLVLAVQHGDVKVTPIDMGFSLDWME